MKKYRLKDEKYRKLAEEIAGFIVGGSMPLEYYVSIEGSDMRDRLIEYGVFDLWFEEEPEFKSGDYIVAVGGGKKDEARKIVECEVRGDKLFWNECEDTREYFVHSWELSKVRHATAEEIKEHNQQLPFIGKYRGKREGGYIIYGCQKIHIEDFRDLYRACLDTNVSSITIAGQEVPMETLHEIYKKTY